MMAITVQPIAEASFACDAEILPREIQTWGQLNSSEREEIG